MPDITKIRIKKLFKELEWVKSDLIYHKELLNIIDKEFIIEVDNILDNNKELKKLYSKKEKESFIEQENKIYDYVYNTSDNEVIHTKEQIIDTKFKNIYRQIAKLTHPDKVDNDKLNDMYIEATEHYNNNDKYNLYLMCMMFGIEVNDDIDIDELEKNIQYERDKIKFMQSTYSWKWYITKKKNKKEEIILNFIENKLK